MPSRGRRLVRSRDVVRSPLASGGGHRHRFSALAFQKGRRHVDHEGVHHEAPGADVLRSDVRALLGWIPPGGQFWPPRGHQLASRPAVHGRSLRDARRPAGCRHPVDRSRLWKRRPSRTDLSVAHVASGRALVRGRAPDRPDHRDNGAPGALANLTGLSPRHRHHRRQGGSAGVRDRDRPGGRLRWRS